MTWSPQQMHTGGRHRSQSLSPAQAPGRQSQVPPLCGSGLSRAEPAPQTAAAAMLCRNLPPGGKCCQRRRTRRRARLDTHRCNRPQCHCAISGGHQPLSLPEQGTLSAPGSIQQTGARGAKCTASRRHEEALRGFMRALPYPACWVSRSKTSTNRAAEGRQSASPCQASSIRVLRANGVITGRGGRPPAMMCCNRAAVF